MWFQSADINPKLKEQQIKLKSSGLDWQAKHWSNETYTVTDEWFKKLVEFSDLEPTVDAFASKGNNKLQGFWNRSDDAFKQDWSEELLWMNPPFSKLDQIVQKILLDEAQGILIVPCSHRHSWFTVRGLLHSSGGTFDMTH